MLKTTTTQIIGSEVISPGSWKQKRSPDKIGTMEAEGRRKGRRGKGGEKRRVEENLREWDGPD